MKAFRTFLPSALAGVLLVTGAGCPSDAECVNFNDCGAGRYCEEGVCIDSSVGDGDGDGDGDPDAGEVDKTPDAGEVDDAGVDAGPTGTPIGPEGGTVYNGEAQVVIPAGALDEEVAFLLVDTGQAPPAPFAAYSNVYRLEPADASFAEPVEVTLPFTGDPLSAAIYRAGESFTREGGEVAGGTVTQRVGSFGEGFVSDGAAFVTPPDERCPRPRLIEGYASPPAAVRLFLDVADCRGVPMTELPLEADGGLAVTEDGDEVDDALALTALPLPGEHLVVGLVVDLGQSTGAVLDDVVAATQRFAGSLLTAPAVPTELSVWVFDGAEALTLWQPWTSNLAEVEGRLGELATFAGGDPSSSNLNGAVVDALDALEARLLLDREANRRGAQVTGQLFVFADGPDTAGRVTDDEVEAALDGSEVRTMATLLTGGELAPGASVLADRAVATSDPALLPRDLGYAAAVARRRAASTYHLAYCSPRRAGEHEVSVTVGDAEDPGALSHTFLADGFEAGCDQAFLTGACDGVSCGGLGCGRCPVGEGQTCDPVDGGPLACVDRCAAAGACGGESLPVGAAELRCDQPCPEPVDAGPADGGAAGGG